MTQLLLGAILGAVFFVPVGYIIRVWLSRAADSVGLSPDIDANAALRAAVQPALDELRTPVGQLALDMQLLESKLTLMATELADFFDKTRKSEERQRGLLRRTEAAMGEDGGAEESDQRLLQLIEERTAEQGAPAGGVPESPEEYYRQQAERLGL